MKKSLFVVSALGLFFAAASTASAAEENPNYGNAIRHADMRIQEISDENAVGLQSQATQSPSINDAYAANDDANGNGNGNGNANANANTQTQPPASGNNPDNQNPPATPNTQNQGVEPANPAPDVQD